MEELSEQNCGSGDDGVGQTCRDLSNADAAASDGERPIRQRSKRSLSSSASSESSSSSSEDEEGASSLPPNKRLKCSKSGKFDPRVDSIMQQVNYISGYLSQLPHYIDAKLTKNNPSTSQDDHSSSQFLVNPCKSTPTDKFKLGDLIVEYDDKKVIPAANSERLKELHKLQHFDSQAWKGIRYKSTLQSYAATPGFVSLKVNEELCHFNKTQDYLASAENMLAGLTNAELEYRDLLKQSMQDLVNWAAANPTELNASSLFDKVSSLFGPSSTIHKCSEKKMQLICGRRSECIEIRRERILKEINNANLIASLRNVPPSAEYLFSREGLTPLIQSLGGSQSWLNTPNYLKAGKVSTQDRVQYKKSEKKHHRSSTKTYKTDKRNKFTNKKQSNFRRSNRKSNENTSNYNNKQE